MPGPEITARALDNDSDYESDISSDNGDLETGGTIAPMFGWVPFFNSDGVGFSYEVSTQTPWFWSDDYELTDADMADLSDVEDETADDDMSEVSDQEIEMLLGSTNFEYKSGVKQGAYDDQNFARTCYGLARREELLSYMDDVIDEIEQYEIEHDGASWRYQLDDLLGFGLNEMDPYDKTGMNVDGRYYPGRMEFQNALMERYVDRFDSGLTDHRAAFNAVHEKRDELVKTLDALKLTVFQLPKLYAKQKSADYGKNSTAINWLTWNSDKPQAGSQKAIERLQWHTHLVTDWSDDFYKDLYQEVSIERAQEQIRVVQNAINTIHGAALAEYQAKGNSKASLIPVLEKHFIHGMSEDAQQNWMSAFNEHKECKGHVKELRNPQRVEETKLRAELPKAKAVLVSKGGVAFQVDGRYEPFVDEAIAKKADDATVAKAREHLKEVHRELKEQLPGAKNQVILPSGIGFSVPANTDRGLDAAISRGFDAKDLEQEEMACREGGVKFTV